MATKKEKKEENQTGIQEFADQMLENLNSKFKNKKIFYNLGKGENPAKVNRWYNTKSWLLNGICSGDIEGGFPGGRMVEISGPESIGKSHLCYQAAQDIQANGGICLYIDTEFATESKNLSNLGIDVSKRFIYAKVDSIEEAFEAAEEFLKEIAIHSKKIPIGIFYDSVGGIGSIKERETDMKSSQQPGLNAKAITLGIRRIMPAIHETGALFVLVNQEYDIIGAGMYEQKTQTKGGKFIRYGSSIRLGLQVVTQVYPNDMDKKEAIIKGLKPCGIRVRAKTNKNKVSPPFRTIEFDIHFGVGIKEHMSIYDLLCSYPEPIEVDGKLYEFAAGAWRTIKIFDAKNGTELDTIKFRKGDTEEYIMHKYRDVAKSCLSLIVSKLMQEDSKKDFGFGGSDEIVKEDDSDQTYGDTL